MLRIRQEAELLQHPQVAQTAPPCNDSTSSAAFAVSSIAATPPVQEPRQTTTFLSQPCRLTANVPSMLTSTGPVASTAKKFMQNGCFMWVHLQASICTEWEQSSMVLTPGRQMGARVTNSSGQVPGGGVNGRSDDLTTAAATPTQARVKEAKGISSILEALTGEPSVSQSSSSSEDNNTATTQKKPKTIHRCILQRVSKSKTSQAKLKCHVCDSCYQSYRQYYAHLIDSTCAQRKETKLARESAAAAAAAAVPPQPTPTSPPSSSADPNVAHVVVPRKEHRTTAATTGLRDIRKAVRQQQQPPAVMSTAAVTTPTTSSLASPGIRSHYVVRSNSNSTVQMKIASPEPQAVENVGEPPSKYFRVSTAEANAFSSNNNGLLRKRKPSNLAVFKLKLPPSSSSPRGLKDLGGGADSSPIPAERYGHNRTPLKPLVSPALPALVMTVPKLISPLELQMSSSASSSGSSSAAAAAEETTADIRPQSGLGEAMEAMNSSQAAADYSNENDAPLNLSKTPTAGERSSINDATMAAGDENGVVPTMTMMEMPALLPLRKRNSLASTPEEMISPGQEQQTIPSSPAKIRKIAASPVCQKWTGSKCPHTETASLPSLSLMEHAMDQAKLATLKVKLTNLLISFLGEDRVIEMGYPETDILGVLQDLLRASNVPVLTAEDGCSEGCRQMAESVSHTQLKFRFLRKETEVARGNIQRMLENVYMEDSAELKQNLWA